MEMENAACVIECNYRQLKKGKPTILVYYGLLQMPPRAELIRVRRWIRRRWAGTRFRHRVGHDVWSAGESV